MLKIFRLRIDGWGEEKGDRYVFQQEGQGGGVIVQEGDFSCGDKIQDL